MNDRNVNVVEEEGLCAQRELRAGVNALRRLLLQKRNAKFYPYTTVIDLLTGISSPLAIPDVAALASMSFYPVDRTYVQTCKASMFFITN